MHVLVRETSAYNVGTLILGVFPTEESANGARSAYLQRIHEVGDPWSEQASREVEPEAEVQIFRLAESTRQDGERVFMVVSISYGFGQEMRELVAAYGSLDEAVAHAERIHPAEENLLLEGIVEQHVVGELDRSTTLLPPRFSVCACFGRDDEVFGAFPAAENR